MLVVECRVIKLLDQVQKSVELILCQFKYWWLNVQLFGQVQQCVDLLDLVPDSPLSSHPLLPATPPVPWYQDWQLRVQRLQLPASAHVSMNVTVAS